MSAMLAANLSDGKILFLVVWFVVLGLIIGLGWPRVDKSKKRKGKRYE